MDDAYLDTRVRVFFRRRTGSVAKRNPTHDMRTLHASLLLDRPYAAEEIAERLVSADFRPFCTQFHRLITVSTSPVFPRPL